MITTKSMMNRFSIRGELLITIITVTLVAYMIYLTGQFGPEKLKFILIDAPIAAAAAVLITTAIRYRRLSSIIRSFHDPNSDAGLLKGKIFSHARYEGLAGSSRWLIGIAIALVMIQFQTNLEPENLVSIVITLIIIMPISFIILYLTAENLMSVLLTDKRIRNAVAPANTYRPLNLINRIMILIGSITIMPLGILGFFLYLVNSNQLKLDNLGLQILFISILSFATIAISLYEMAKNTRRSVRSMVSILENMKEGRLTIETAPMLATNEFGMMSLHVNALLEELNEVVSEIFIMSTQLADMSEKISSMSLSFSENAQNQSASSEEISATIEEISAGMDSSSRGAQHQSQMIDKFISIKNQLSASVQQMRDRVRDMLKLTEVISSKARAGEDSLSRMNTSIQKIDQSSGEMTNIVGIINDISDKINLLSLNAAIEAARAGDYGRGFAVVADEISKLADRTASSIKDIDGLIRTNEDEIRNGMAIVRTTVEVISDIIKGVGEISEMMKSININMQEQVSINEKENVEMLQVKQKSDEIRNASSQQKIAIEEIVRSITTINQITQTSAQGAEEMTASARKMAGMADNLKSRVDYFKIE